MPATAQEESDRTDVGSVRRSALRWRWVLGLAVLGVVGLIWVTWAEIRAHERRQATDAATRRQGNLSIAVSHYLTRTLGSADAVSHYLTGVHLSAPDDLPEQLALRARANSRLFDMLVCYEGGSMLSSGGSGGSSLRAAWCKSWLDTSPADAKSFPGDPVTESGVTFVPLLTRLPAAGQGSGGVLALLVDVRNLLGVMQEYTIPDETVILVAGTDGRVRARWHSATGMTSQSAPEAALLPAVLATGTFGQLRHTEGRQVLASARRIQSHGLTVMVVTSVRDTLAEPGKRVAGYGAAAALATLGVVTFALLLLGLHTRVLRTAESLSHARQRLQSLNTELEEKVQARTAQLELAYSDLEFFTYTVAHDVRAPIAAIRGFAGALTPMVEATGHAKSAHFLQRIVANATQMGELTEALLALGKLSRAALVLVRIDLSAMANDVLLGLRERESTERVVETSVQQGLVARGDVMLVRQVLENLLGNAWKFSAARRPAVIRVSGRQEEAGWMTVMVSDNGEGFDTAHAQNLFKPFTRMHSAAAFPGTGVGLATVEKILRLHGGRVWIASSPEDGTTAYFRLPTDAS